MPATTPPVERTVESQISQLLDGNSPLVALEKRVLVLKELFDLKTELDTATENDFAVSALVDDIHRDVEGVRAALDKACDDAGWTVPFHGGAQ